MTVLRHVLADDAFQRFADELADGLADRIAARLQDDASGGWLDTKGAAAYAGCSVNALRKAMAKREVQFSQDTPRGKAWFKREWIDAWRGK